MSVLLVNANSLTIPLADKSVHMVATSPPYWGLRDYGTARWEGGDPECDHAAAQIRTGLGLAALGEKYRGGGHKQGEIRHIQFRDVCQKCGAVRLDEQLGLEPLHDCNGWATGEECGRCYVCHMVQVFRELWRVLRDDGVVWLNLGDSYASGEIGRNDSVQGRSINGKPITSKAASRKTRSRPQFLKPKDLVGIPWRVALALQADGWYLRSDVIWSKPNPMPESVTDRPAKAHEYVFLLSKSARYFYDGESVKEPVSGNAHPRGRNNSPSVHPKGDAAVRGEVRANADYLGRLVLLPPENGRNRRTVWNVASAPYSGSHFATFPPKLVELMIKAGTSEAGCCLECGTPWQRIVQKGSPEQTSRNPNPVLPYTAESNHRQGLNGSTLHMSRETLTLGWEPGCKCKTDALPVPCVVLDPFTGSGTTVMVARQLGRHGIGLDLSFDYLQGQARPRLELDRLEQWENGEGKRDDMTYDNLPLFAVRES